MSVLYVALPIAIAMGGAAMWACVRSIRGGQFDDLETPAVRVLIDEKPIDSESQHHQPNTDQVHVDQSRFTN